MFQPCPLCNTPHPQFFYHGPQRDYLRCQNCGLIFVPEDELLSLKEEKARYDLHENDPANAGYRRFLKQLTGPLIVHIGPPPQLGLDFGCGPGPALAHMLESQGYEMNLYDPFYEPKTEALNKSYDFVTCTETMEHFFKPAEEWKLLIRLLKPGAWLGIMTKLVDDPVEFPGLHYIKDATHVSFYSRRTFKFLAKRSSLAVKFFGDNTVLVKKPESICEEQT